MCGYLFHVCWLYEWRPLVARGRWQVFSLIALHLIFETKISYWTWGSSAWLGSLSSELRGASASPETRFTARLQALYEGVRNLNSGSHMCVTSHNPSPWSHTFCPNKPVLWSFTGTTDLLSVEFQPWPRHWAQKENASRAGPGKRYTTENEITGKKIKLNLHIRWKINNLGPEK